MVINLEVVAKEFLGPLDLKKTQAFEIYDLMKVVVINKNKDVMFAIFQIMLPGFESLNNG